MEEDGHMNCWNGTQETVEENKKEKTSVRWTDEIKKLCGVNYMRLARNVRGKEDWRYLHPVVDGECSYIMIMIIIHRYS